MSDDKDAVILAQSQVIGILMEVIKKLNENSVLEDEYFAIASSGKESPRLSEILEKRQANSEIVSRLLSSLDA